MKFFNFHLMPYAHVDLDAIAKNGSAWGNRPCVTTVLCFFGKIFPSA